MTTFGGRTALGAQVVTAALLFIGPISCQRSSTPAAPAAESRGDACTKIRPLVAAQDLGSIFDAKFSSGENVVGYAAFPVVGMEACVFRAGAKDKPIPPFVHVGFTAVYGPEVFAKYQRDSSTGTPTAVAGIGDEATWQAATDTLVVRQGGAVVGVKVSLIEAEDARTLELAGRVARIVVQRLQKGR